MARRNRSLSQHPFQMEDQMPAHESNLKRLCLRVPTFTGCWILPNEFKIVYSVISRSTFNRHLGSSPMQTKHHQLIILDFVHEKQLPYWSSKFYILCKLVDASAWSSCHTLFIRICNLSQELRPSTTNL